MLDISASDNDLNTRQEAAAKRWLEGVDPETGLDNYYLLWIHGLQKIVETDDFTARLAASDNPTYQDSDGTEQPAPSSKQAWGKLKLDLEVAEASASPVFTWADIIHKTHVGVENKQGELQVARTLLKIFTFLKQAKQNIPLIAESSKTAMLSMLCEDSPRTDTIIRLVTQHYHHYAKEVNLNAGIIGFGRKHKPEEIKKLSNQSERLRLIAAMRNLTIQQSDVKNFPKYVTDLKKSKIPDERITESQEASIINTLNLSLSDSHLFGPFNAAVRKMVADGTISKGAGNNLIRRMGPPSEFAATIDHMIASALLTNKLLQAKQAKKLHAYIAQCGINIPVESGQALVIEALADPAPIVPVPLQTSAPIIKTSVLHLLTPQDKDVKDVTTYRHSQTYPWLIKHRQLLLGATIITGVVVLGLYFAGSLVISELAMMLIIPATAIAIGLFVLTLVHPLVQAFEWSETEVVKVAAEDLPRAAVVPSTVPASPANKNGVGEKKNGPDAASDEAQNLEA